MTNTERLFSIPSDCNETKKIEIKIKNRSTTKQNCGEQKNRARCRVES